MNRLKGRGSAAFSLASALLRSAQIWRCFIGLTLVSGLVLVTFVGLFGLVLTGPQRVDRDLGRYEHSLRLEVGGVDAGTAANLATRLEQVAKSAGAQEADAVLLSTTLKPDAYTGPWHVLAKERNWASDPLPQAERLVSGRWPSAPGEVAVSQHLAANLGEHDSIRVLSGLVELRPVGIVRPEFSRNQEVLYLAPGTWSQKIATGLIQERFPNEEPSVSIHWLGGNPADVVRQIQTSSQIGSPGQQSDSGDDVEAIGAVDLIGLAQREDYASKFELMHRKFRGPLEQKAMVFTLPATVLVLMTQFFTMAVIRRRMASASIALDRIGIPRAQARLSYAIVTVLGTVVAWVMGIVVMVPLAFLTRLIMDRVGTRPVSPWPSMLEPMIDLLGVLLAAWLLGQAVAFIARFHTDRVQDRQARFSTIKARIAGIHWHPIRRLAALVSLLSMFFTVQPGDSFGSVGPAALGVMVAGALMIPDLLALIRLALPRGVSVELAHALIANAKGRTILAILLMSSAIAFPAVSAIRQSTYNLAVTKALSSKIVPGQLHISGSAHRVAPPAPNLVSVVSQTPDLGEPIRLKTLSAHASSPGQEISAREGASRPRLASPGEKPTEHGGITAIDSPDELQRLFQGNLSAEAANTLLSGGLIDMTGKEGPLTRSLVVKDQAGSQEYRVIADGLPSLGVGPRLGWDSNAGTAAFILTAAAQKLGMNLTEAQWVYTGVSDKEIAQTRQNLKESGFDTRLVDSFQATPDVPLDLKNATPTLLLGILAAVLTMVVVHGHVRSLRQSWGRLLSIGLSPRWMKGVMS